jgi:large subunit ribosomal protein L23
MATEIIFKPIVTEKLTIQGEKLNRYGFIVEKTANKIQIKKAVEELYGVTVTDVNTIRYAGKIKSRMTKAGVIAGKKNSYKKAIITLAGGEKIDFYSNI